VSDADFLKTYLVALLVVADSRFRMIASTWGSDCSRISGLLVERSRSGP
jgi:hypothetical protein